MKHASGKSNLSIVKDYLDGNRPFVQVGYTSESDIADRKNGEIWTDVNGKRWIKKNGFKKAINSINSSILDVTKQVCKDCSMEIKWGNRYDQIFFNKTGRCQECVAKYESKLRLQGKFEDYEQKKYFSNQLSISRELKTKIDESISYIENNKKISFPNGDGTSDEWTIERRDLIVKDLKKDLKKINKSIATLEKSLKGLSHVE